LTASPDLTVSNYCFHEMTQPQKRQALAEGYRVLRPGGRLVVADMMFGLSPWSGRDRRILIGKLCSIGRRGLPGILRVLKNAARFAMRRWEHPETAAWWETALERCGFEEISVELLRHEGGIAAAHRPLASRPTATRASTPSREARPGSSTAHGALKRPLAPRQILGSRDSH